MHMLRAMGHLPSPEHIKTITRNMRDNHGKGGLKFEHFKVAAPVVMTWHIRIRPL